MSRIVCRPGATSRIFGSELTVIDAVAMSPWTPPAIFILSAGEPLISTASYRLRRAQVGLHVQRDDRQAVAIADAVLLDAADVARIDRQELARHGRRRDARLDLVGDLVQLPAERVGNHRDRLGEADVADAALVDLALELLAA